MSGYEFTSDWFSNIEADVREVTAPFRGRDGLRILEVGSYEGRSTCWFLDNLLTGAGSEIVCIEPWAPYPDRPGDDWDAIQGRFWRNIAKRATPASMVTQYRSWEALGADEWRVDPERFDVAFIDGDHSAAAVLRDAVRAWEVLKVDGRLMFDDLAWRRDDEKSKDIPKTAIEAFAECYGARLDMLRRGPQLVAMRKVRD